MFVQKAFQ